jgi:hypothetical protein
MLSLARPAAVAPRLPRHVRLAPGGAGQWGNITIAPRCVILDRSQIRADAFGGPGGNVRIAAEVFL